MSDVEKYWEAVRIKFGSTRKWSELHPQEQMLVLQSVNMLLQVLNNQQVY